MMKHQSSIFSVTLFFVLFVSTMSLISLSMAGPPYKRGSSSSPPSKVYDVMVKGDISESHYLSVLSSVLGRYKFGFASAFICREAARKSILIAYLGVVPRFVARLTPEQALEMERQPEVLQVTDMFKPSL